MLKAMHTDHLDWPLPAHRRGTLRGMDAAQELTRTYLQRVPRWWAGKGPAAKPQISRSATDAFRTARLPSRPHRPSGERSRFMSRC
ncbi:hypothetical protein XHV734_2676 [Xanthomonas hortorum pv. vitians]|nr:hypothetical protein XHV734_2676 [Xanthomonas hortorum pv. vitians]